MGGKRLSIQIGAALSLTGRFAAQGSQAHHGLMLWAEDANEAGGLVVSNGVDRAQVRLRIIDDQSRASLAAALTEQLIKVDRVDLLMGPYGSGATLAAARVATRHGRVLWNHGGATDALTAIDPAALVNVLSPTRHYFSGLLDLCHAHGIGPRLALIHGAAGTFGRSVIDGAQRQAERLGFEIAIIAAYPAERAMPGFAADVLTRRPDVVLGAGNADQDIAFARALAGRESGPSVVGLVATPIQRFGAALGPDADGLFGPSQWEPSVQYRPDFGPTSWEFAARYRARFGLEPDYPAAQAYATGLILQHCVEQAGSLEEPRLRELAGGLELTTFYGRFRLDPVTGEQAGHRMLVVQRQGTAKLIVWPPSTAEVKPVFAGAN